MELNAMKKAQVFTTDFVISIILFLFLVAIIFLMWNNTSNQINTAEARKDIQNSAQHISDSLLKSRGSPDNWNNLLDISSITSIGLANEMHALNLSKVRRFREISLMDWTTTKSGYYRISDLFGITGKYDWNLTVTNLNGEMITVGVVRPPIAYYADGEYELLVQLNNKGLNWSFYCDSLPAGTFDTDIAPVVDNNVDDLFKKLVIDAINRRYSTIIIEKNALDCGGGLSEACDNLTQLVNNGTLLIVVDSKNMGKQLLCNPAVFNMSCEKTGNSATSFPVVAEDELLNATVGESLSKAASSQWVVYQDPTKGDNPLHIIVECNDADCTSTPYKKGAMAYWDYGKGRIYWIWEVHDVTLDGRSFNENLYVGGDLLGMGEPLPAGFE
ncbi:hypothetical protein HY991_05995 [Candidatus Micrarchaeota archaeon]|nr:hypothetical protein [Candidatus Micrarchaeota archaeon]